MELHNHGVLTPLARTLDESDDCRMLSIFYKGTSPGRAASNVRAHVSLPEYMT